MQLGLQLVTAIFSCEGLLFIISLLPLKVRSYHRCRMRWCPNSVLHLLRCVRLRACTRRGKSRLPLWIREIWAYVSVLVQSLYFNSLTDSDVVFDSIFEPVFWTVDYVTRWFGTVSVCLFSVTSQTEFMSFSLKKALYFWQVFVFLVVTLTSSIVVIAYLVLLPLILNTYSPPWIAWHVCYGHWNLIMIAFHYYKATKTSPGYPPTVRCQLHFSAVPQITLLI